MNNVQATIRNYLKANNIIKTDDVAAVDPDAQLALDSLAIIRLISFIETEFRIPIPDSEIVPENFETIRQITTLIEGRLRPAEENSPPV